MIHCRTFLFLFQDVLQWHTVLFSFFKIQHTILAGDSPAMDDYFLSISLCFLVSHHSIFETTGLYLFTLVNCMLFKFYTVLSCRCQMKTSENRRLRCNALQSHVWYSPLLDNQPLVGTFKTRFSSSFTHPEKNSPRTLFLNFLLDGVKSLIEEKVFDIYYNFHIYLSVSCHRKKLDCFGVIFPNSQPRLLFIFFSFQSLWTVLCLIACFSAF